MPFDDTEKKLIKFVCIKLVVLKILKDDTLRLNEIQNAVLK